MIKRLQIVGNSLGLIIDKPILELLKITPDTELEITTDGERLIIVPVRSPSVPPKRMVKAQKKVVSANERTDRKSNK